MARSVIAMASLGALVFGPYLFVACSDKREPAETTATTTEGLITPATANVLADPDYLPRQETSVAFATGFSNDDGTVGRWVIGWNNGNPTGAGWSNTLSATGDAFFDNVQSTGTDWGNPGRSQYDGAAFSGWFSDPSIAAVTDPSTNNGGKRMLYSMIGCTDPTGSDPCSERNDVIMALSNDGGVTWGGTVYVSGQGMGGSPDQGGGGTDNPWIASNRASPYHTFVAWGRDPGNTGWLAQVSIANPDSGTASIVISNIMQMPAPAGTAIGHPRIDVGQYTGCGASAHEAVFAVFPTGTVGRCDFDGLRHTSSTIAWYLDLYDVVTSTWYGPWLLSGSAQPWPNCVGGGPVATYDGGTKCFPGSAAYCADNDPRAQIAVDWNSTSGKFYVSHTVDPLGHGTRAKIDFGSIGCVAGSPSPSVSSQLTPSPCDPVRDVCTWDGGVGPDGGPRIQDEWGPAIAFNYDGATPRVVETWYTTREDPNNQSVDLYMMYSENSGSSWSAIQRLTVPQAGETVPWDYHLGDWSDYQSIAPDTITGGFLGAWSGDCRLGAANCAVYTSYMQ